MKKLLRLGALLDGTGARFCVWAPTAQAVDVVFERTGTSPHPLHLTGDGYFTGFVPDVCAGEKYRYRLDNGQSFPDPASRYQPEGVHGPSQVVDPAFNWSDQAWHGVALGDLVLYELHVGTFTPEGTFLGVVEKLPQLKELGISAIELMPLADFPGDRNWGYDGVDLFAPAHCYGTPDDLRHLVNTAHGMGMAVFVDVVYNHLGPDGAYLGAVSPYYYSPKHKSPWGNAVNLDDVHCGPVRQFFIENALHWVHEYHIDGLRLDATHAMIDDSSYYFVKELADRVRTSLPKSRKVLIFAEDDRNLDLFVRPGDTGGYGLDGVWADDFHHQIRALLHGDNEGYYQDFSKSTVADVAKTLRQGWFYTGQHSVFRDAPRGFDTTGIPVMRFLHCIQNHDQIGNRALGERLNHQIDPASYRAASALLLCSPATPLLFMGQEWAASSPFCYFTDHHEELGKLVTEGRRNEFGHFSAFKDPEHRHKIPDPQALKTFNNSTLNWGERGAENHQGILLLYQAILDIRRNKPVGGWSEGGVFQVDAIDDDTLAIRREAPGQQTLLVLAHLRGKGTVHMSKLPLTQAPVNRNWELVLTTEDRPFSASSLKPQVRGMSGEMTIEFFSPATVILRAV